VTDADERRHKSGLPYRLGVGVVMLNRQGLVFVGKRLDSTMEAWQMPQGGIDPGETPWRAAVRELGEETGAAAHHVELIAEAPGWFWYDLPDELVGVVWKGKYAGQKQKWYAVRFTGADSDIDIATEHQEFSHWQWVEAGRLVDLIVPFKRQLYTDVLTALAGSF
jgi:putative (di)nucleoside polyphosphate hydrolase